MHQVSRYLVIVQRYSPYIVGDEVSRKVEWVSTAVREQTHDTQSAHYEASVIRQRPSHITHLSDIPLRIRFII